MSAGRDPSGARRTGRRTNRGTGDRASALRLIYFALGAGVAMIVLIFLVVGPRADRDELGAALRWTWLGVAVLCTLAIGFFRAGPRARESQDEDQTRRAVVVWSLAEAPALLAAVGYLLAGDLPLLVAGLVLFVFLFARHRPASFEGRP